MSLFFFSAVVLSGPHSYTSFFKGAFELANLDLDFKIRISDLRYLFLDFLFTVRLGNPKKYLTNFT